MRDKTIVLINNKNIGSLTSIRKEDLDRYFGAYSNKEEAINHFTFVLYSAEENGELVGTLLGRKLLTIKGNNLLEKINNYIQAKDILNKWYYWLTTIIIYIIL